MNVKISDEEVTERLVTCQEGLEGRDYGGVTNRILPTVLHGEWMFLKINQARVGDEAVNVVS